MPTRSELARRLGCDDVPLVLAVLLVALAVSPAFVDPYTSVKWYALEVVGAAWLLGARLVCGGRGLPSLVRRTWTGWAVLLAWIVLGSMRQGLAWAVAPLVARGAFCAIVLASYWSFRRTGAPLGALRGSLAVAASLVAGVGLAQLGGFDTLPVPGGDRLSATFGNVNMAAQFLGLALVVILAASQRSDARWHAVVAEIVGACTLAYVVVAGARSVALSLAASLAVLALARRLPAARLARALGLGAVLVAALLYGSPAARGLLHAESQASKSASARWRLAVWADTLDLVRDHPLGVGAGNFEHAFVPYSLGGRSRPGEGLVFRSPHDDYLRLVAEEGVPGAILMLALLVALWREVARTVDWRSEVGALLASCGAFLAVEAFLQFPFEMALPALLAAVLLGLAFAAVDTASHAVKPERERGSAAWPGHALVVVLAVAILAGLLRVATAEVLFATRRDDPAALERACALDPRRVDACTRAAWLRSRSGDHAGASRLLEGVLAHSRTYLPALKLRAEDRLAAGERGSGCGYARAYDALLAGTSSLRDRLARECPTTPAADGR